MLYDPKWEVKADPYSLENLITWLERQPADGRYQIYEPGTCLLGQFARAMGALDPSNQSIKFDLPFHLIAFGTRGTGPCVFGAALERAKATLSKGHG